MTDAPLGIVRDYNDLRIVLRRMAEVRNISRKEIDRLAGWPDGLAEKALAEEPLRNLGPATIAGGLGALGIMLIAVDDPDALAKFTARAAERDTNRAHMLNGAEHPIYTFNLTLRRMRKLGKKGAKARMKKIPRWKRKRIARNAATVRWKRVKARKVRRAISPTPARADV